jgi:tetratricopeptide (TPR) repeat protein
MTPSYDDPLPAHEGGIRTRAVRGDPGPAGNPAPGDLIFARRALDQGRLEEAEGLIHRALRREPASAEAWGLMGALRDRLGESHAAYRCFRTALALDRYDRLSLSGLRRCCDRFHLDFQDPSINPAAVGPATAWTRSGSR